MMRAIVAAASNIAAAVTIIACAVFVSCCSYAPAPSDIAGQRAECEYDLAVAQHRYAAKKVECVRLKRNYVRSGELPVEKFNACTDELGMLAGYYYRVAAGCIHYFDE